MVPKLASKRGELHSIAKIPLLSTLPATLETSVAGNKVSRVSKCIHTTYFHNWENSQENHFLI